MKYIHIISYLIIIFIISVLFSNIHPIEKYEENTNIETTNDINIQPKYTLSLLVICKNESIVIDEFIKHYKWQGVEHIYLIDNGSTDNMKEILNPYIYDGYISYYYLEEQHKQIEHYNTVYNEIRYETKWLIICDADEYIYNKNKEENIATYVNSIDYNSIAYILLNWKMFGSSNYKIQPVNNIRTSFTWRKKDIHELYKSIINTKLTYKLGVHDHEYDKIINNGIKNPSELALNHYAIMSEEYFKKVKMQRGDVHHSEKKFQNIRDMNYFNAYDYKEEYDDELKNLTLFSIPAV